MLTAPQKTSLEVELRHLERALREARLRMAAPERGTLVHRPAVTEAERQRLEPLIEQILAEIAALAEVFDLRSQIDDPRSELSAEMIVAWSDLSDILSPKLKRYGDVDPALAESLDPGIRKLIYLAYELGRVATEEF